jgi:hypothetical protein
MLITKRSLSALLAAATLLLSLTPKTSYADGLEATLPDGKKVLLNSDATWSYKQVGEAPQPNSSVQTASSEKPGVYEQGDVEIRFEFHPGTQDGSGRDQQESQYIKVSATNTNPTKVLDCYPAFFIGIQDYYGNRFRGSVPDTAMSYLRPGESKEWKILIRDKLLPTARSLLLSIGPNDFGCTNAFEISIPIKPNSELPVSASSTRTDQISGSFWTAFSSHPVDESAKDGKSSQLDKKAVKQKASSKKKNGPSMKLAVLSPLLNGLNNFRSNCALLGQYLFEGSSPDEPIRSSFAPVYSANDFSSSSYGYSRPSFNSAPSPGYSSEHLNYFSQAPIYTPPIYTPQIYTPHTYMPPVYSDSPVGFSHPTSLYMPPPSHGSINVDVEPVAQRPIFIPIAPYKTVFGN